MGNYPPVVDASAVSAEALQEHALNEAAAYALRIDVAVNATAPG